MPYRKIEKDPSKKKLALWKQADDLYNEHGTFKDAEAASGIGRSVLHYRRTQWQAHATGVKPPDKRKQPKAISNEDIERIVLECYSDWKRKPSYADMALRGVKLELIRARYGNITNLMKAVQNNHAVELSKHVTTGKVLFERDKLEDISKRARGFNRFVVTTAVAHKTIHAGFLSAIKSYAKINKNTLPIIVPTADPDSGSVTDEHLVSYDAKLKDECVLLEPMAINNSISISGIKIRAKQINPLTGLDRLGQRNSSIIIASPKQQLKYVAVSKHDHMTKAEICTGALTMPEYSDSVYAGARTAALAKNDHVMGAVIVEKVDDDFFHFRQVQADEDGAFIDLCKKFTPDGKWTLEPATLIPGDWHVGATDESVKSSIGQMLQSLSIERLVLHDFFDGYAINHHDADSLLKQSMRAYNGLSSLRDELVRGADDLRWLLSLFTGEIVIVKSNHDEFIDKYISSNKYHRDALNAEILHELFLVKLKNRKANLTKTAYEMVGFQSDRVTWLDRDQSYRIANVELGMHGDRGANGSRPSLNSIENAYGNCVVGHNHSAAIQRGVYRVGTSTRFDLDYNDGPSSWTHTCCLLYNNGSRQLINFLTGSPKVKGRWCNDIR